MAAMKRSELREAVRQVIREELADLLPSLMREVLSEAYLRRLVTEHAGPRKVIPETRPAKPQVRVESAPNDLRSAVFGEDPVEEDTPQPLENDDLGIYQDESQLERNKVHEGPASLLSRDNPMAFIYEGIDTSKPMKVDGPGSQPLHELMGAPQGPMPIPESHNGQGNGRKKNTGFDLEHMKRIVKGSDAKLKEKVKSSSNDLAYEEARLKAARARLDVPVGQ